MKSRVAIIGLGGTIAMASGQGGLVPHLALGISRPASEACRRRNSNSWISAPYRAPILGGAISSISQSRLQNSRTGEFQGAVVVQGTDTLEETSFAYELVRSTDIPVAFTGAMRRRRKPAPTAQPTYRRPSLPYLARTTRTPSWSCSTTKFMLHAMFASAIPPRSTHFVQAGTVRLDACTKAASAGITWSCPG